MSLWLILSTSWLIYIKPTLKKIKSIYWVTCLFYQKSLLQIQKQLFMAGDFDSTLDGRVGILLMNMSLATLIEIKKRS